MSISDTRLDVSTTNINQAPLMYHLDIGAHNFSPNYTPIPKLTDYITVILGAQIEPF